MISLQKTVTHKQARIAVVTPYKGQKRLILRLLRDQRYNFFVNTVDINTIDAFQGDEAEIVIFCTTRTVHPTNFFTDFRRINVAFSRAKNELIVIGSLKYFQKYEENTSPLPAAAQYITQYGNIVKIDEFGFKTGKNNSKNNPLINEINIHKCGILSNVTIRKNSKGIQGEIFGAVGTAAKSELGNGDWKRYVQNPPRVEVIGINPQRTQYLLRII